ncbi:MAG: hypothetical protein AAFO29_04570, partial [Actinomycetota bacterium]
MVGLRRRRRDRGDGTAAPFDDAVARATAPAAPSSGTGGGGDAGITGPPTSVIDGSTREILRRLE